MRSPPAAVAGLLDLYQRGERGYVKKRRHDHRCLHLAGGVGAIAAAFYPKPVIVRLSNFKSNEYAALIGRAATHGDGYQTCHEAGKYAGICGQAPSDFPEITRWLVEQGIDSISLNSNSVLEMTRVVLEMERARHPGAGK